MSDVVISWAEALTYEQVLWCAALCFIALDVLSGTVKSILTNTVSSEIARRGVMHKAGFLLTLVLTSAIDCVQALVDIGVMLPLMPVAAIMIILCEIYSILEHIQELNPEIDIRFISSSIKRRDDDDDEKA